MSNNTTNTLFQPHFKLWKVSTSSPPKTKAYFQLLSGIRSLRRICHLALNYFHENFNRFCDLYIKEKFTSHKQLCRRIESTVWCSYNICTYLYIYNNKKSHCVFVIIYKTKRRKEKKYCEEWKVFHK